MRFASLKATLRVWCLVFVLLLAFAVCSVQAFGQPEDSSGMVQIVLKLLLLSI